MMTPKVIMANAKARSYRGRFVFTGRRGLVRVRDRLERITRLGWNVERSSPAEHFFHTHDGASDLVRGRFHAPIQPSMPRVAFIGEHRKMVGVEQNHEWVCRLFNARAGTFPFRVANLAAFGLANTPSRPSRPINGFMLRCRTRSHAGRRAEKPPSPDPKNITASPISNQEPDSRSSFSTVSRVFFT